MAHDLELAPPLSPGQRNPNKLKNLRPGQGAEGRKKYARSLADKLRRCLESPQSRDGRGRNELQQIFDNIIRIAKSRSPHAVTAAQFLCDRAYGKPKPSDEEMDAIPTGGVQLIYVERIDPSLRPPNLPPI